MKTAILFSGGKDSCLAMHYAMQYSQVVCLISILSENKESYMFHTPNISRVELQAQAIGLPLILQKTSGVKEEELRDLEIAIKSAIDTHGIDAIVTGAIESVYQASRIQKICDRLGIECFNPLWQKDQFEVLNELVLLNFDVVIIGVFAQGFDEVIGKTIDARFIELMHRKHIEFMINPAGEGGEFESFVLNAPFFKKRLNIKKSHIIKDAEGGKLLVIDELQI